MQTSYGTATFAPDSIVEQHVIQIELVGGQQWKKGFCVLELQFAAIDKSAASTAVTDFLKKGALTMKCPTDRKLSAAITGDLLRLVSPHKGININETILLNGLTQTRLNTSRYKITWYHTVVAEHAADLNYALPA